MKKFIVLAFAMVLVLGLAGIAAAGVSGSLHDLASGTYTSGVTGTSQVCVFCHHPHRGVNGTTDNNVGNDLLWNMQGFGSAAYSAYQDSGSLNNSTSDVDSSAPQSYLCMACHDGAIATGSLVKAPSDTGANITTGITVNANIGTTFVDDHPVNMFYSGQDTGLATPSSGVVASKYPLFDTSNTGTKDTMQCATCHNVHAGDNSASAAIEFMRGNIDGSKICTDCHTNK